MDQKHAGSSLDSLISSFSDRILELRELVIARNMYPPSTMPDLSSIDSAVSTLEYQLQMINERVREEMEAVPKAKKLIRLAELQQKKLEHMLAHLPSNLQERSSVWNQETYGLIREMSKNDVPSVSSHVEEEPPVAVVQKEKKGRGPAPRWYVTAEELNSLSSYMRGRLTLEKVNAAVNDMAAYADANARLIAALNKGGVDAWQKAQELRDISLKGVKGEHFFLESDMKGSVLKPDHTGKAILTILRHLGRVHEARIGHQRVMVLAKPQ